METATHHPLYQICLSGHLPADWEASFGLKIALLPHDVTLLTGELLDQAALFGVLWRIRDLGIPLLSVNQILVPSHKIVSHGHG